MIFADGAGVFFGVLVFWLVAGVVAALLDDVVFGPRDRGGRDG